MNLYKRFPDGNIYHLGIDDQGKDHYRAVIGGVPNVSNETGELVPFDNALEVITSHPIVKYVIKQGAFFVGFHNKVSNKYLSAIKLRTGESIIKTAIGDTVCTPTVKNKHTLQWKYGNGSWIREYCTERQIKEVMFQKAGQKIRMLY